MKRNKAKLRPLIKQFTSTHSLGSVQCVNPIFKCVAENLMSFFLCVLLAECHGSESDFAHYKVRVPELPVLQWGLQVLLGIGGDGCFDNGAPPPPEASGSSSGM